MKKLLLSLFIGSSFAANAQLTVFEDSFETYTDFAITGFGDWLTLDFDLRPTYTGGQPEGAEPWPNAGTAQAWIIFNPSTANVTNESDPAADEVRNFDPHTGSKYAASWAAVPGTPPAATANNDMLVSPAITLGASNNVVSFWIKSLSDSYDLEEYRVYVYNQSANGGANPTTLANFGSPISGLTVVTAPYPDWEQKTYTLNANLANQTVRIGIRNVGSDHYMLMVDDFKVTSSTLAVNDAVSAKFGVFPNPVNNVLNVTNSQSIQINKAVITDLNGRTVKAVDYSNVQGDIQINVADLSSGMYMLNISSAEGTAVKKIVKN